MEWIYTQTVNEACETLNKYGDKAAVVAGSTFLSQNLSKKIQYLIDVSRCGLDFIKNREDFIDIGSMCTINKLMKHKGIESVGKGIVKQACSTLATNQLRNMITVGGNVVSVFPWCDLPPALLALNAVFHIQGVKDKYRTVSADTWFSKQPKALLEKDELLLKIELPKDKGNDVWGKFIKFTSSSVEDNIVDLAVYMFKKNNSIKELRIVAGGISGLPVRLNKTEKFILAHELNINILQECCKMAKSESVPKWNDRRVDAEYKKHVIGTLLKDIFSEYLLQKTH